MRNPLVVFLAAFALVSIPPIAASQNLPNAPPAIKASIADADVTPPRVIYSPEPKYPPDARAAGHQGTSILSLVVGRDGYVHDISIVRKLDAELDESAIATARSWRYEPARKDDDPVEVRIQVRIRFRLYEGDSRKIAELWDRSEQSDPKADWALSKAYFQGLGVPQDAQLGLWFLKRAADWNLPEAQFQMGEHFYKDPSGPRDDVAAYMWYALSKRAGGKQGEQMLKVLAPEMSAAQLSEAEMRVNYWPEDPPK
jgi:TonB family protein